VYDVVEMRHKGLELFLRTTDGEKKRLNGRKFVTHPRKRQRDGV
jgi:RNase P/RNase MRP subunit p29